MKRGSPSARSERIRLNLDLYKTFAPNSSPTQNKRQLINLVLKVRDRSLMDEQVVNFTVEAEQSLKEVSYAIKEGAMSSSLKSSGEVAYFNLTTREGSQFTVRLCMKGFQVSFNMSRDQSTIDTRIKVNFHICLNCGRKPLEM